MIGDSLIREILSHVSLAQLVGEHVKLKKAGGRHKGLCPFHNEKTPSFTVADALGLFHCFGCGEGGDAISFLRKHLGLGFLEACDQLASRVGVRLDVDDATRRAWEVRAVTSDALGAVATAAARELWSGSDAADAALRYLHGRGLTDETLAVHQVGLAPSWDFARQVLNNDDLGLKTGLLTARRSGDGVRDSLHHCLLMPVGRPGRIESLIGRPVPGLLDHDERAKTQKLPDVEGQSAPRIYLAGPRVRDCLVLVEGELDALSLAQAEVPTAALLGASVAQAAAEELDDATVYYLPDPDAIEGKPADRAARKAAAAMAPRLGARLRVIAPWGPVVERPDGTRAKADANEVLQMLVRERGEGATEELGRRVRAAMSGAPSWVEWELDRILEECATEQDVVTSVKLTLVPVLAAISDVLDRAPLVDVIAKRVRSLNKTSINQAIRGYREDRRAQGDEEATVYRGFKIPRNWDVSPDGVLVQVVEKSAPGGGVSEKRYPVCERVPLIVARARDVDTDEIQLTVEFDDPPGPPARMTAGRETWMSAYRLQEHAARGMPVHSNNGKALAAWFTAFEDANAVELPYESATTRMGWHGDCFVLTDETLTRPVPGAASKAASPRNGHVPHFVATTPGTMQLGKSIAAHGSAAAWIRTIAPICRENSYLMLIVSAAFTPPLLEALGLKNFWIEFASVRSSIGKTTSMGLAESVWGRPDGPGFRLNFLATLAGAEAHLAACTGIATYFDERTSAASEDAVKQLVYMLANGAGKTRGSLRGHRAVASWHTVGFTTGEMPLDAAAKAEGLAARAITLDRSPFGDADATELIDAINSTIAANHGVAGRAFVEHLLSLADWRSEAIGAFWEWERSFRGQGNRVASRKFGYAAAIMTAAELAAPLLGWTADDLSRLQALFLELAAETPEVDLAREAMEHVVSWWQDNLAFFGTGVGMPSNNHEVYGCSKGRELRISPRALRTEMARAGFVIKAVQVEWRRRGWIRCAKNEFTFPVKDNGKVVKAFVFDLSKCGILDVEGASESNESASYAPARPPPLLQ